MTKSQNLKVFTLDSGQTIEDYFFSRDDLINHIITIQKSFNIIPEFEETLFRTVLSESNQNNIEALKSYLRLKDHLEINLGSIKYQLSSMPEHTLKTDVLLKQIKDFFEDLY